MVFGMDVESMQPDQILEMGDAVFGFPFKTLEEIPAGEYYVQALVNRYETFNLSTGHTVKLPPDRGEGQQWNRKPGNFYSKPVKVTIDPSKSSTIELIMDQEIPPISEPEDSKYIRHIKIQSKLLSEFWGRPMYFRRACAGA